MKLLKLGKYTINPAAIAYIDWVWKSGDDQSKSSIAICFFGNNNYIHFLANSPEAKALQKYVNNPNNTIDLMPNQETEEWQDYQERGGTMPYKEWLATFNLCNQLNQKQGEWSKEYGERVSKLEAKLLY